MAGERSAVNSRPQISLWLQLTTVAPNYHSIFYAFFTSDIITLLPTGWPQFLPFELPDFSRLDHSPREHIRPRFSKWTTRAESHVLALLTS